MKARHYVALLILAFSMGILIVGCGLLDTGTTIDSRIRSFVTTLNEDQTSTYTHLVPSSANASKAATAAFWEALFPAAEAPYTFSMISTSPYTATDVQLTITSSVTAITKTYRFVMQDTGTIFEDWYIADIYIYSTTTSTWTSLFGTT